MDTCCAHYVNSADIVHLLHIPVLHINNIQKKDADRKKVIKFHSTSNSCFNYTKAESLASCQGDHSFSVRKHCNCPESCSSMPSEVFSKNKPWKLFLVWSINAKAKPAPVTKFKELHIHSVPQHAFFKHFMMKRIWSMDHYFQKYVWLPKFRRSWKYHTLQSSLNAEMNMLIYLKQSPPQWTPQNPLYGDFTLPLEVSAICENFDQLQFYLQPMCDVHLGYIKKRHAKMADDKRYSRAI